MDTIASGSTADDGHDTLDSQGAHDTKSSMRTVLDIVSICIKRRLLSITNT